MTLKDIALLNLKRRKAKAALVVAGLAAGVATLVALQTLAATFLGEINHKLEKYGANILVTPKAETLNLSYEGLSLGSLSYQNSELRESDLARVRTIKNSANLAAVGPMLLGLVKVKNQNAVLAGVAFESLAVLKPWWKLRGRDPGPGEAVAGSEAARLLDLTPGQSLYLNGRSLVLSGVLETTGSQDDGLIFTDLAEAQSILNKPGLISLVEVAALCLGCPVEEMVKQIAEVWPDASVTAIMSVVKGRLETMKMFRLFSWAASILVALVGGLAALVSLMAGVKERTTEIGIFRAIGFRRRHVLRIVMLESLILSTVAGLTGYLGGLAAARVALIFLAEHQPIHLALPPWLPAAGVGLALTAGLLAGLYPARLAAGLDPQEALRSL
ncbi:MAG: FtsX-like permease family protein [Thermodesulfobacteriota bacterium]